MCGIVAVKQKRGHPFPLHAFISLMEEASIRGVHATGVSYFLDDRVRTFKTPKPMSLKNLPSSVLKELSSCDGAIGHVRYSTSDLQFNQPFQIGELALVHNGVVSQADPSKWEELFGVSCATRNDSEILLHVAASKPYHPVTLENTSQACALLEQDSISFWRNAQRPLYYVETDEYLAAASTKDIIKRALGKSSIRTEPFTVYRFDGQFLATQPYPIIEEDLQNV